MAMSPPDIHASRWISPGISRGLAILASYLAASCAVYWPLPLHPGGTVLFDLGDPALCAALLEWGWKNLPLHLSVWESPTFFFPDPRVIYWTETFLGFWPLFAPLRALTGEPVAAMNLLVLALPAAGGTGGYVLARRWIAHRGAAWAAGFLMSLSMPFAGVASHFQMFAAAGLPWAWWMWMRWNDERRRRWALGLGALMAWMFVSSVYVFYMIALPVAGHCAVLIARRRPRWRAIAGAAIAGAVFAAPAGYFVWRYATVSAAAGVERGLAGAAVFAARPADFLAVIGPRHVWGWALTREGEVDHILFPGIVTIGLAVVGMMGRKGRMRPVGCATGADLTGRDCRAVVVGLGAWALIGAGMALGPAPGGVEGLRFVSPFYWLHFAVPGLEALRATGRFMLMAMIPLGLLAGMGLERLFARSRWTLAPWLVFGAVLLEHWPGGMPLARADYLRRDGMPDYYQALAARHAERPAAILDFPTLTPEGIAETMLYWAQHGVPIIQGYSGHANRIADQAQARMLAEPVENWPEILAGAQASHLVIHGANGAWAAARWDELNAAFDGRVERMWAEAETQQGEAWIVTAKAYANDGGRGEQEESGGMNHSDRSDRSDRTDRSAKPTRDGETR